MSFSIVQCTRLYIITNGRRIPTFRASSDVEVLQMNVQQLQNQVNNIKEEIEKLIPSESQKQKDEALKICQGVVG